MVLKKGRGRDVSGFDNCTNQHTVTWKNIGSISKAEFVLGHICQSTNVETPPSARSEEIKRLMWYKFLCPDCIKDMCQHFFLWYIPFCTESWTGFLKTWSWTEIGNSESPPGSRNINYSLIFLDKLPSSLPLRSAPGSGEVSATEQLPFLA